MSQTSRCPACARMDFGVICAMHVVALRIKLYHANERLKAIHNLEIHPADALDGLDPIDFDKKSLPDTSPRIEQNDAHWSAGYRSGMKDAALMLRRIANHVTVPRSPERLREDVLAWAETLDDSAQTEKDYPGRIQNPMNVSNVAAGDTSTKPVAETEELQQVRCIECGDEILLKAKPDGRCTDCHHKMPPASAAKSGAE